MCVCVFVCLPPRLLITSSVMWYDIYPFTVTVIKNSCTRVARQRISVIRVGVAYMNVHILRHLKEELGWAIDK